MARAFDSASTQYCIYSSAGLTALPLTFAAWGYPLQTNASAVVIATSNTGAGNQGHLLLAFGSAGVIVAQHQNDGGTTQSATSSTSYSANQWQHACGVFAATNSRSAYLNAGGKGTNTNTVTLPTPDNVSVGATIKSGGATLATNGYIAHAAIWNVALSDADVARLYNNGIGVDPRSVRPDALVAYWPLINGDGDQDCWGNYHLTATNTPTYAQHPPVLMRSRPKYVVFGSTAPTVGPVTVTGTRTIGQTVTANATPSPGDATLSYQWEKSSNGVGAGTDISGETASTLALTYADFGDILDTAAYVRVGVVATKNAVPSTEEFSPWYEVSAGGAATVGSPFVSSSIR